MRFREFGTSSKQRWFHGTPDAREVEKQGGFTDRTVSVSYIKDLKKYSEIMQQMEDAREKDKDMYFSLLKEIPQFKGTYTYKKPLFLSDHYGVAKTYADPRRAFDYQGAVERVFEVDVQCDRIVEIAAPGEIFRFISVDRVRRGFINSGVSQPEIDALIAMFNFYIDDNKGIQTDVIAAIGNWLKFDCIDVKGVLDSYHGGTTKSTVRMVLDPRKARVKVKEGSPDTIAGSYTPDLVFSKQWLCETLSQLLNGQSAGTIYALGSWYGNIGVFLQKANIVFDHLVLIEQEREKLEASKRLLPTLMDDGMVSFVLGDATSIEYPQNCTIINTSGNEMSNDWLENTPFGTCVVIQGRNNTTSPVPTQTQTLREFDATFPLSRTLYLNEIELSDPGVSYSRFMKIGIR